MSSTSKAAAVISYCGEEAVTIATETSEQHRANVADVGPALFRRLRLPHRHWESRGLVFCRLFCARYGVQAVYLSGLLTQDSHPQRRADWSRCPRAERHLVRAHTPLNPESFHNIIYINMIKSTIIAGWFRWNCVSNLCRATCWWMEMYCTILLFHAWYIIVSFLIIFFFFIP